MATHYITKADIVSLTWTPYAKRQYALSMYQKGKNFPAAAILLRQKEDTNTSFIPLQVRQVHEMFLPEVRLRVA
jgi:hypothetical protein